MLRRLLRLFLFLLLAVVVIGGGAVAVFTQLEAGRQKLAGIIAGLASGPGRTVRVENVSGLLSGALRIGSVSVEDEQGRWLVLRGVEVDWSPAALLGREFHAQRIHVSETEMARLPVPPAVAPPPSDEPFSLPVSVRVDLIELPEVGLAEPVAGLAARLAATGSASAQDDPLTVGMNLSASRIDGPEATLEAKVDFAPADNRLTVDLTGREPSGGLIAGLLRLPADADVAIDVTGSGPLEDWRGKGSLSVGGSPVTTLSVAHRLADGSRRIAVNGEGDFAGFLPENLAVVAQGTMVIDAAAVLAADGGIRIEHAVLESDRIAAEASGSYDPAGTSDLKAQLVARGGPVELAFGAAADPTILAVRRADLAATGSGTAPQLQLDIDLATAQAAGFGASDVTAAIRSQGFDLAAMTGPVSFDLNAGAVGTSIESLAPLLAGPVRMEGQAAVETRRIAISALSLRNRQVGIGAVGNLDRSDGSIDADIKADIVAGALPAAAQGPLGERVALSARIARSQDGRLSVSDLAAESGPLAATGTATLSGGTIDASLAGTYAELGQVTPALNGAVRFEAAAKGALERPEVSLTLGSARIENAGRAITDLVLTATGVVDPANPAANVSLGGAVEGQAIAGTAVLRAVDGGSRVENLQVSIGENRISGVLDLDAAFAPQGTLQLSLPDIAPLAAMANEEAAGDLAGPIVLGRDGTGVPVITANLRGNTLSRGDVRVEQIAVSAQVADYLSAPAITGNVAAARVVAGANEITSVDIDLSRDGDWIGFDGGAQVGGVPASAKGRVRLVDADGARRIVLNATSGVSGFLPPNLRSLAGDALAIDVSALLADGGAIQIERGNIVSPTLTANLSGRLDVAGDSAITLDLASRNPSFELMLGSEPDAAVVDFRTARLVATGPLASPAIDLVADLAGVQAAGFGAANVSARVSSPAFKLASQSGNLTVALEAAALGTQNAALAPLLAGALSAQAQAALSENSITITSLSLRNGQLDASATGQVQRNDAALQADFTANVLASALPAAAHPALGERVALSGKLARGADGALVASDLKLASGPLQAGGNATLSDGNVTAALSGAFEDLSRLAPQARGAIRFDATAKGAVAKPEVSLKVEGDRIESAGRAITGLALTASGVVDPANPAADVTLRGSVEGQAITGSAALRSTDAGSRVENLLISLGENRISGSLDLDQAFVPQGTLEIALPDVGPLAALALETVSGDVNGRIVFSRGRTPSIDIDARIGRFARDTISGRDIAVSANLRDYLAAPTISGTVKAAQVRSGDTQIDTIDLTLTRDGDWTGFNGGARVAGIPATAAGRVRVADGRTTVELRSAGGSFQGVSTSLVRPTTVVVADGRTRLDRLSLALGGGSAEINGTAGEVLDLSVRLAGVPASLANNFAPGLGAAGTVSGTVSVAGPASAPRIGYDVTVNGAATAQTRDAGVGPLSVTSSGTFANNRLEFRANASDGTGLTVQGGGGVNTGGSVGLDLRFTGRVPFTLVTHRIAAQGLSLTGGADLDVAVTGSAAQPSITGFVRTSGARFLDTRSGIAVNELAADIALGGTVATIRSLTGTLSTGGSLSAGGTVGIDAASGFPADLTLRLVEGRYTDGRVVTTTLNGDLRLSGPLVSEPLLSGRVALGRTVITVPETLPPTLAAIDVKHRNASAAVRRQAEAMKPEQASGGGGGLRLDLNVDAPQQIFIQGRGLDAELGGSIRLTGTTATPIAIGRFELRRGRLGLLGKRIEFTSGTVGFEGSLVPRIDFTASTTASDATATIEVAGEANDPKFAFSSSPALPQDEILARIVFGRSMSNLSPLQIAQLAEAAAQLAGIGGSTSLLQTLQNRIGVDDLDIKTDEETGRAAVAVGKYLNDRTYLGLEKGEGAGTGKATIDLLIGRGLKLRGEARDDGRAKGGIFYEKEY